MRSPWPLKRLCSPSPWCAAGSGCIPRCNPGAPRPSCFTRWDLCSGAQVSPLPPAGPVVPPVVLSTLVPEAMLPLPSDRRRRNCRDGRLRRGFALCSLLSASCLAPSGPVGARLLPWQLDLCCWVGVVAATGPRPPTHRAFCWYFLCCCFHLYCRYFVLSLLF